MADTRGLMACSKCGVFPELYYDMDNPMGKEVKIRCPHCGVAVKAHDYIEAAVAWNFYYGVKHEEKRKEEETEMKDILELVGKIEELLMKSKFEWIMTYDSKSKAWNFQIKEK